MEGQATDGIDGRFAKDHHLSVERPGGGPRLGPSLGAVLRRVAGDGEAAQVFLGAQRQAVPRPLRGAAKLGADGSIVPVPQQEDGVGLGIGVESAGVDERC